MSSLTTISSGMEESIEVGELVNTRLSLSLVVGAGSRPPPPAQALLPVPASQPQENEAAPGPGRKRKGSESGRGGSVDKTRQHVKRARSVQGGSDVDDDNGGVPAGGGARKKLRLTSEQAALMEKSFRAHNVISHDEKNDLARQLGLKPRQVEVWFQNRRARTKLKQTELECEMLRRWCDRLSHDNERLRRELAEARSSSSSPVFLSKPTLPCPSCNNKLAGSRVSAK